MRPGGRAVSAFFAPPLPRVIAHRGLATGVPENTLAAFSAALDAGATHIETDVQATADGQVIVLHDRDLARVLGDDSAPTAVASLSLAQLRELAGRRLQICTLFEALQTFPSALFNIDVKAPGAVAPAAAAIRAAGAEDRVLIASFSGRRRRATTARLRGVATSASAVSLAAAVVAARCGLRPLSRALLSRVDAVQIPEKVLGIRTTTAAMIAAFHAASVEVHIWTINDPVAMHRLLDAGVDGIVTDRCDRLVTVLEERR